MSPYREILRSRAEPMQPIVAGCAARLRDLSDVRAILFDLYGTLFISSCGGNGANTAGGRGEAFADSLAVCGLSLDCASSVGVTYLDEAVAGLKTAAREQGIEYPEIDIVAAWALAVRGLVEDRLLPLPALEAHVGRLALEFEVRVNPVWPMPGLLSCLDYFRSRGVLLGIISNAQFFTIQLFPALIGQTADELGFDEQLQLYSYRCGRAKPGGFMFELARDVLNKNCIDPSHTLHVGNDMLNDVWAAKRVGFRTGLFAGDAHSLRLRPGISATTTLVPDVVITELAQLATCFEGKRL